MWTRSAITRYSVGMIWGFCFGFDFFFWDWGLNSELHTEYEAGTLPLEPHLQSRLLWLFWRWNLMNYFAQAGLKPLSS
jgi:hypothetical protein